MKSKTLLVIMLIIIGSGLYRNFNFKTLKFEPFWQSMMYILGIIVGILLLWKGFKNK